MFKNLFCFFIFIFIILFAVYHARFGLDLTDEGTYLSTSLRLTLGDKPYRDELRMGVTAYNVILSPIFKFFPGITLFQMRILGVIIQSAGYILLFLTFKKYAPAVFVALACACGFLFNNYFGIYTPSYNLLSSVFSMMAICLLILSLDKKTGPTIVLSSLSGLSFAFAILNYFSLAVLIPLPLFFYFFVYIRSQNKKDLILPSCTFTLSTLIVISAFIILLAKYGILFDLINNLAPDAGNRGGLMFERISFFVSSFLNNLPNTLILFLSALLPFPFSIPFLILGILVLLYIPNLQFFYFSIFLSVISLFINKNNSKFNISLLWGILLSLIYSLSSYEKTVAGVMGVSILYTVSFINIYKSAFKNIKTSLVLSLFLFLFMSVRFNFISVYRDEPIPKLTKPFTFPKLIGIYSTPARVEKIEGLLSYLTPRIKHGDYLLTYNNFPLLYYLTDTRPSYGYAWIHGIAEPENMRKKLFLKMINEKRVPNYVVRIIAPPGYDWGNIPSGGPTDEDPILNEFVFKNYFLEKTVYPFEIWKSKR